jgi:hypothetical protein
MYDVKLVAVEHSDSMLVAPHMAQLFITEVIPLLQPNTVVVMEGGRKRGLLLPGFPGYQALLSQLGPMAQFGYTPLIFSDDPMHTDPAEEVIKRWNRNAVFQKLWNECVSYHFKPRTWREFVETIKQDRHGAAITKELDESWKDHALYMNREFHERDEAFAQQISRFATAGPVIFVGGVLHCASLEAAHGWGTLRYDCDRAVIGNFYTGWYFAYKSSKHYP